ncbi:MAG: Gfo/Idh/MocA family protein [Fimbriimonadaceae bacterium]
MADPIRLGIVGCGAIAPIHANAVLALEGAVLAGVQDHDLAQAETFAASLGVPTFTTLHELCREVDAVLICTPSGTHAEIANAAMELGVDVLVEKPLDTELARAESVVHTAARTGRIAGVVSQHRFARPIQEVREVVQSGRWGRMLIGDAKVKWYRTQAYYDSGKWRGTRRWDGGCLMNQSIHTIDMLLWVMGPVKAVNGLCRTMSHDMECEDVGMALVEFESGAVGTIMGTTVAFPGFQERFEVHGERGSAIVEADRIIAWHENEAIEDGSKYGGGVMVQPAPNVPSSVGTALGDDDTIGWGRQHRLQIEDFVAAVRDRRTSFLPVEEGLAPLKTILAIMKSSVEGGRRVELSELEAAATESVWV